MTLLVGSADTSSFSDGGTVYSAGYGEWFMSYVATESGVADEIGLYLSSYNTVSSLKLTLRDAAGVLLDSVTVSGITNGWAVGALSAAANIVAGETYIIGWVAGSGYLRPFANAATWSIRADSASTYASTAATINPSAATQAKPENLLYVSGVSAPSASIDTDNEIDQFQRDVALNHSFENPLTKCLINGLDHLGLLQNGYTELKYIKRVFDVAGSDTCDVVIGDGVAADVTISGVTVNTVYPHDVPFKKVDSNSISKGIQELAGPYAGLKITVAPTHGTLDTSTATWLEVDINDVFTPTAGYIGTDTIEFEIHDPDESNPANRTQTLTITLDIKESGVVVVKSGLFKPLFRSMERKIFFSPFG